MPGKLTSAGIGNLKRLGKFYDGTHGLFLQVYPTGAKCWQQRLTVSGRRRTLGLGGFPAVGLANARAAACKNWLLVHGGGDPFAKGPKDVPTFEAAAAAVIERKAPTWTDPKHPKDWQNSLMRYAFPSLGKLLVSQIEIDHVLEVLTPIWDTRRSTAQRVRRRIRAILDWAITKGYRTDNPAGPAIHGVLPKTLPRGTQKRHHAAVPYTQVPQLVVAMRRSTSCLPLRLLSEFVVLTAVRSGEAREAEWSEFDFDTATWFIPGSRMKTGFPHRVPAHRWWRRPKSHHRPKTKPDANAPPRASVCTASVPCSTIWPRLPTTASSLPWLMPSPSTSSLDRPRCSAKRSSCSGFAWNVPSNAFANFLFHSEKQQVDSRMLSKFSLGQQLFEVTGPPEIFRAPLLFGIHRAS